MDIMTFIRYKKFGNKEYAYEVTAYWDPNKKKPRQKSRYLGIVIDKKKKLFRKIAKIREKLILDFGDVFVLHQFMKNVGITNLLETVFEDRAKYLLSLICYRLCHGSAMNYARSWYEGSVCRIIFSGNDLSSQRISEFLEIIGDEHLQRNFFKSYISSFIKTKKSVIIDTTALPNQIHFPFSEWGYNDGEIDKQIRFLFVVDKDSLLPIFFRYLPGNIVDVSSLNVTIEELRRFGVKNNFVLMDAGFFCEENIKSLYENKINFLIRLPAMRVLYKDLIKKEIGNIEKFKNAVRYGKRVLFIKKKRIKLFGKDAYAYIILDPERKGRETKRFLLNAIEEKEKDKDKIEFEMKKRGVMVLLSSLEMKKEEVIPFYYMRQIAERLFGFSKDDLNLVPLRVHKEETLRGYLLLIFITLIVFSLLKKEIEKDYTVEEILLIMRNLKCKVYDNEIIVQELTKQQKEITEKLKIIVPKNMGI
jgi:transposase